jgi:hypothetical protein
MTGTEVLALAVWYAFIALGVLFLYLISLALVDAATLAMSGSFAGHGVWNATIEADLIAANISRSSWEIIAGGVSA